MKKLLIVTEKFPPNTETAANRPLGWAKYFHQYGYKPVIVTRNWDIEYVSDIISYQYTLAGDKVIHEVYDEYEVYYLPFKGNYRTRFILRHRYERHKLACKALTFVDQLTTAFGWFRFSMYRAYFVWADQYLDQNNDIDIALITASPFTFFRLGKRLKRKFKLKWVADYRDPWTVPRGVMGRNGGRLHKMMEKLEHKAERRWVATADHITSVSEYITQSISDFLQIPGTTIYNGYLPEEKVSTALVPRQEEFTFLYNGSLYDMQQIEIFLDGFKLLVDHYKGIMPIRFKGIGIDAIPVSSERVRKHMHGYEEYLMITGRIPKAEYLAIQATAQVLVIAGTGPEIKGITSSKIFDYILIEKPVLLVGNDKDVVEDILTRTEQGIFADTPGEVFEKMKVLIEEFLVKGQLNTPYNQEAVAYYSRANQTGLMAGVLDEVVQVKPVKKEYTV
jgi:glycosyltransferase involved in cell wall biosynthesis